MQVLRKAWYLVEECKLGNETAETWMKPKIYIQEIRKSQHERQGLDVKFKVHERVTYIEIEKLERAIYLNS